MSNTSPNCNGSYRGPGKFRPGDLVEVLSEHEILATLDEKGTVGGLPFMPEMLKFCGRTFRVAKQAFKTCVDDQEMREVDRAVFLEEVRCDGSNHGGCGRACLIFWKEDWLRPAGTVSLATSSHPLGPGWAVRVRNGSNNGANGRQLSINRAELIARAHTNDQFFCQSSEILNATQPLPWWSVRQYVWDLEYNRTSLGMLLRSLLIAAYNKVAHLTKLKPWRFVAGGGDHVESEPLNLQAGELVRVKSLAEIRRTLDAAGKHQNLLFAPSMTEFCGRTMRVQERVEQIVLEGTTKQRKLADTVLLQGATCDGVCHRLCPRQSYLFWRECWLERV